MTTKPRISTPPVGSMNAAQRAIYDASVANMGGPYGPRMVLLNHPALAEKWSEIAEVLKGATFPKSVRELVIILVARHWRSDFEWYAHAPNAAKAGLSAEFIDAIKNGKRPVFKDRMHEVVYDYVQALQERHDVDDTTYAAAREELGDLGVIEMTALMGHYTSVAMTLIAHRVPLPEGEARVFGESP